MCVCVFRCLSLTCSGTAVSTTSDLLWTPTSKTTLLELWHTSTTKFTELIWNRHIYLHLRVLQSHTWCWLTWFQSTSLQRADSMSEVVHGPLGWGRPTRPHPGSHEGKVSHAFPVLQFQSGIIKLTWLLQQGYICKAWGNGQTEGLIRSHVTPYELWWCEFPAERKANERKLSKISADIDMCRVQHFHVVFEFPYWWDTLLWDLPIGDIFFFFYVLIFSWMINRKSIQCSVLVLC